MGGPESAAIGFAATRHLIKEAHKGPIGVTDLIPLAKFMQAGSILQDFENMMAQLVWRAPKDQNEITEPVDGGESFQFMHTNNKQDFIELKTKTEVAAAILKSRDRMRLYSSQGYSLAYLLVRLISPHLAWVMMCCMIRTMTIILQAWVLWTVVRIAAGDPEYNYGDPLCYFIAALLPLGAYCQSLVQHNCYQIGTRAALVCRTAALALIFEKVRVITPLHLGSKKGQTKSKKAVATLSESSKSSPSSKEQPKEEENAKKQSEFSSQSDISSGQLLNLISTDATTLVEAVITGTPALMAVIDICACLVWIGWVIGWAAGPLAASTVLLSMFQVACSRLVSMNKISVAKVTDARLRSLSEFLAGIQVVKFYAWEINVRKMIRTFRIEEAHHYVEGNIWKLVSLSSVFFAGGIFSVVLFAVKLAYDSQMTASDTFVTMTLIGFISTSFSTLPRALTCIGTCSASLQRIQAFLVRDVITGLAVPHIHEGSSNALSADNSKEMETFILAGDSMGHNAINGLHIAGDFGWPGFAVRNLNLICPEGSLTVVIGSVGSGKSTLLQAVLGVCAATSPQYTLQLPGDGSVAYVAQEAFIYDTTVRENITFGKPFEEAKYRRVLKACSLVTDLQQWGGDMVEVTGGTLSGGQRQRLSLARACYADASLYIVDDPISAVDASVGRHLLQNCFRGFLKGKTVLLATHHPAPARFADQVVLMEMGSARVCPVSNSSKEAVRQLTTEHPEIANDSLATVELAEAMSKLETDSASAGLPDFDLGSDEEEDDSQTTDQDILLDELIGKSRQLRTTEVEAVGSVSIDVYKQYIRGGGVGMAAATVCLFVLAQGVRSVQDWWFSAWTRGSYPELSNNQSLYILGILVGLMVILSLSRTVVFGLFTIRASSSLHDRMFEAIIASPLHFFEKVPLGRILNRFSKDLDYCDDLLPRTMFDFLQITLWIVGALALLVYSIPWFAIAIPLAFPIFAYLVYSYMPASRYLKRIEGTSRSPTMNTFQTVVNGLTTLRVYNRLDYFQQLFFSTSDVTTNAILHSNSAQRWMGIRTDWVAVAWVCIAAFLSMGLRHTLSPSLVGLCLSQSLQFTGLMQFAVRMAAETENLMTSAERLDEYSKLPAEENKGTLVASPPPSSSATTSVAMGTDCFLPPNWPEDCDIVAKGLTMAYHSNQSVPVLKNLHFTIRAGQRVAVVGRTGAGKSSLLSAFYRTVAIPAGSLQIGGVSTTDIDVFALRSKLGIIPQVPTLFHGTFRYNLDPFGHYTDEAMLEALKKVRLDEYVAQRSGLDTYVGDGGGNLSVGQRQLLCAARVLLTRAPILFMDEATANIDEETDAQIQQIIREEASWRKMTVITIAHRLNTIMDYDLVLVLSQGRLVEYGNPQELVSAGNDQQLEGITVGETSTEHFTTDVRSLDEIRQFAQMVQAMN